MPLNQRKPLRSSDKKDVEDVSGDGKRQNEDGEEGDDTPSTSTGGSTEEEEEEGLECSLVAAGQRRCSGRLTATAQALRFVPHSDPDRAFGARPFLLLSPIPRSSLPYPNPDQISNQPPPPNFALSPIRAKQACYCFMLIYTFIVPFIDTLFLSAEVAYTRVAWAGWQMAGRGSRGENGGFLHFELLPFAPSHSTRPAGNARRGGRRGSAKGRRRSDGVDELEDHKFAHFAAGGPRMGRNPRLRAIVADIRRLSSSALDHTSSAPRPPPLSLSSSTVARPQVSSSASKEGIVAKRRKAVGVPSRPRGRHTIVLGSDGEEDRIEVDVETGKKAEEGDQGSEEDRERENESDENEEDEEEEGTDEDEEEGRGGGNADRKGGTSWRGTHARRGAWRGGHVPRTPDPDRYRTARPTVGLPSRLAARSWPNPHSMTLTFRHRPFVVVPYSEIEVACLERALFSTQHIHYSIFNIAILLSSIMA